MLHSTTRFHSRTVSFAKLLLVLPCLLAMVFFSGCSRSASLTVVNQSGVELTNVVVSGEGFSDALGSIAAGGERKVALQPKSETGVRLEFDAQGKHFALGPEGYLEASGFYQVKATVTPEFALKVESAR